MNNNTIKYKKPVAVKLAPGWNRFDPAPPTGKIADGYLRKDGLTVTLGVEEYAGKDWLHATVSRPLQVPDWKDLRDVKRLFIGPDKPAYQVHPPAAEAATPVSVVVHLWSPLGINPYPEFWLWEGQI